MHTRAATAEANNYNSHLGVARVVLDDVLGALGAVTVDGGSQVAWALRVRDNGIPCTCVHVHVHITNYAHVCTQCIVIIHITYVTQEQYEQTHTKQ